MILEYSYSRLCFKADIIESLDENDSFVVHTPDGTFQLTKAEFYRTFPKVPLTKSYKDRRLYSCKYPPKRILPFMISSVSKDLVGDKIKEKIKEISNESNPYVILNFMP